MEVSIVRITLATPPYDLLGAGYGTRFRISAGFLPPLGVGYVASALLEKGYQVSILDCSPLYRSVPEAADAILSWKPNVVGLSVLSTNAPEAYALAREIRRRSSVPIVLGGPHGTTFPRETLRDCLSVDAVVMGEGEFTAVELVKGLEESGWFSPVPGSMVRSREGEVLDGGQRPIQRNLDDFPMPARYLYDHSLYRPLPNQSRKSPSTNIISSRGCPWGRCKFCYKGCRPQYRRHSVERVIAEIEGLIQDLGIREISFWDDVFAVNEGWIFEFCDRIEALGVDLVWSCYARADTVTKEMLRRMGRAGCHSLFLGIETAHQELLDRTNKGLTLEQVRSAVAWAHDGGIEVRGSFMLGLPGETIEMGRDASRFAVEMDLDYAQFTPYHPIWGTDLADESPSIGFMGEILSYKGGSHGVCYAPYAYGSYQAVISVSRWAYKHFYLRPAFFWKHLKKVRSFQDVKRYGEGFLFWMGLLWAMKRPGGG